MMLTHKKLIDEVYTFHSMQSTRIRFYVSSYHKKKQQFVVNLSIHETIKTMPKFDDTGIIL